MVSLDGNGGHLKAAREKRPGFMGPSSSRDMFFHIRPQGRLCGGLREAGHLVLLKIPLPRGLTEAAGTRDLKIPGQFSKGAPHS